MGLARGLDECAKNADVQQTVRRTAMHEARDATIHVRLVLHDGGGSERRASTEQSSTQRSTREGNEPCQEFANSSNTSDEQPRTRIGEQRTTRTQDNTGCDRRERGTRMRTANARLGKAESGAENERSERRQQGSELKER